MGAEGLPHADSAVFFPLVQLVVELGSDGVHACVDSLVV